ncbi:type I polyketide synthase [Moorena sp. SIO2C4]|uniref:type I polyketide synthase n=1 Tax=Moorena sp. SIO2C4 TaxID=2607824 RepID=UPI0013C8709A|nr:type I polyketide synthase [Moorena sp. SIO2C4]NES40468.1 SDR family NAD(P)-dependent oxidoreductase [Moorena sp. SIO2C4]
MEPTTNKEQLSLSKQMFLALKQAEAKLEMMELAKSEPIAIIGIGCRFPGNANTPESFWQLLANGEDGVREIPPERWNPDYFYHPDPDTPGKMYIRHASLVDQVDQFEPEFFGISPREAHSLDPQQRFLLEVTWEALERAGINPQQLENTHTGVFLGMGQNDYADLGFNQLENISPYDATGNGFCFAAGRLSYFLGLQGPSLAIDTACSASLVAIHEACHSLRRGESNLALAGGVQLILSPHVTTALSKLKALSPDGRCKTFDAAADGYGRGEGCGMVVLKRLSDALKDGDQIWAVIRGSAVNHDGPSSGLTVPNKLAQEQLIQQALKAAKIEPSQVGYVEAHGTGTSLGDPMEVRALGTVFEEGHNQEHPLRIGSVKTNIGHLEAAAGIAGLIKVVLQLQHQKIAPSLNFKHPNPYIDWGNIPIEVPTQLTPWLSSGGKRVGGVSSFAISGTNAHIVIEEAPSPKGKSECAHERSLHLLTLSAKTAKALEELVTLYCNYLETNQELAADVCYTANTGRAHFKHRLAVIAADRKELVEKLHYQETGEQAVGLFSGHASKNPPKIVFLFTGQGSQYVNMGRQLYETQPTFRKALEQCDQILESYLEYRLLEVLYPQNAPSSSSSLLDQTAYTQPALFAIEYALAKLWESWGIKPNAVMGHSVGEYVAATIAGIFSLEDGLKLIAARGRLMQQLPSDGEMVSVMAKKSKVRELITPYTDKVAIAAINGPESVVISGETEAIAAIVNQLESEGVKTKRLQVSHAFHSPLMEPVLAEFEAVANQVTYHQPKIPLISNVTGKKVDNGIATANYWVNHIRQTVKFAASMETLHQQGLEIFLEIGAKPILLGMGHQCLPEGVGVWLPSLRPAVDEWQQILSTLGQLYVHGVQVNWSEFDRDYNHQKVVLPTYPFQRKRYWVETTNDWDGKTISTTKLHPLINQKFQSPLSKEIFFESYFSTENLPFLADHIVYEQVVVPGASHISLLLAAASLTFAATECQIEDILFPQALAIPEQGVRTVQVVLTPQNNSFSFQVISFDDSLESQINQVSNNGSHISDWAVHATGKLSVANAEQSLIPLEEIQARCSQKIDSAEIYQHLWDRQIHLGQSFRWIEQVWLGEGEVLCQMKVPKTILNTTKYQLHPTLVDSCFQSIIALVLDQSGNKNETFVPFSIDKFTFYNSSDNDLLWCYTCGSKDKQSGEKFKADIQLFDQHGQLVAQVIGFEGRKANPKILLMTLGSDLSNWLYEVEWRTKGLLGRLLPPDFLLDPVEVSQQLAPSLTELVTLLDNARTSEIGTQLEELSVDYIVQGLLQMGWSYQPTESFDLDAAAQCLGVVPTQVRLFERLLQILAEVGILQSNQQQWQVQKTAQKVNPSKQSQSLLSQYPDEAATLTLLERCASQLSGVLRGEIDPVQLVFPQGDLTTATQLYKDSAVAKVMNTIVEKVIMKAMEKLPPSRGIRLLEIGAGTGGTTSYILPHLNPNQTEYIFTDIGALFTSKAQEKFQDYRFLGYQTLDIEVDPSSQGFESHRYDVIIAANVLHATTSLKQTLSHVRQLLAPGGILVLYEATTRSRWVDLIFGLLEGWWKFTDYELRPDYPLLNREQWKKVLSETGFTQVVTLPEVEGMAEALSQQTVIVAQAASTKLEPTKETPKGWLILADQQGIAQQLASQLHSEGDVCTLVFWGENYQQIAPGEFTINPDNFSEFEQLIETVNAKSPSLSGVVQCWTTEAGVINNINSEELKNLSKLGCGTTLSLVQALVKAGLSQPPQLWLVTCGAQPVPSSYPVIPGLAQSSLWGMGKVISLEHPELNCVRIDLDPHQTIKKQADVLFKEIWSKDQEDQVAWRGDGRYVARLVASHHQQTDATTEQSLSFREDSTYLITGGMGGLGLLVARWMVDKGAKHLVLLGRRAPDDAANQKLTELEMAGAQVVVEKADVSDVESITRVLYKIEHSKIPLAGVIHAAGMLSDGVLQNQSWSSFEQVMAPKVQGAWHLHQFTQNQPLDFFVLFSSAASLLGSPGQGNHSAANGFLDGLAHYRRGIGLPGLSIHWGAVAQVGEAAERGADVRGQQQGMGALSPTQVLESLELLMSSTAKAQENNLSDIEVGVVPIEWSAWQERVAQWPFFTDWQETIQTTSEISKSEFLLKLEATAPSKRRSLLLAHVRRQLALVLGINHPESISLETGFFDLGMDSLTSVEFRNKLQTSFDCSLPSTIAFEYANIESLTDYLENKVILSSNSTAASEAETLDDMVDEGSLESELSESLAAEINQLSEDEMDLAVSQAVSQLDQLL